MEGAGARKRRRIDDADWKKEICQKMKENSQFQEKERLRHIEKRKMKKVENQLLRTELENERLAHEKLKNKYRKIKDQLHAVETCVEFLEGALLSSKETRISATVSETFLAKVKLNEKPFTPSLE
jgi:predicted nuclease with TOPRIM domain